MPNPLKADERTCAELHRALESARALTVPPSERVGFEGVQGAVFVPSHQTTPEVPEGIEERIRELEQAIRDAGCDQRA